MRLALDTNAYGAFVAGSAALVHEVGNAARVGLPLIVLGELRFGFLLGSKLRESTASLDRFLAGPRVELLRPDEGTAAEFAETAALLRSSGRPVQQNDVWIAALCKQHDFVLATRDRGFENVLGLRVFSCERRRSGRGTGARVGPWHREL